MCLLWRRPPANDAARYVPGREQQPSMECGVLRVLRRPQVAWVGQGVGVGVTLTCLWCAARMNAGGGWRL
jgi:hypothetical protein